MIVVLFAVIEALNDASKVCLLEDAGHNVGDTDLVLVDRRLDLGDLLADCITRVLRHREMALRCDP